MVKQTGTRARLGDDGVWSEETYDAGFAFMVKGGRVYPPLVGPEWRVYHPLEMPGWFPSKLECLWVLWTEGERHNDH